MCFLIMQKGWDIMKIIDLSIPYEANPLTENFVPKIHFLSHQDEAKRLSELFDLRPEDFPGSMALGVEEVQGFLHVGTHIDAPFHFGPYCAGEKAKTIDELPLEWFFGDGVVIDVRHVLPGASITVSDVENGLAKINYHLKPFDIVLIMTGWDKYVDSPRYLKEQPGMSREATLWLIKQGIKVIGIDTYGFDRAFKVMFEEYKKGVPNALFPAHFLGREVEYCHIEKLGNLDKIPKSFGFKVIAFPQNVKGGSAGATRPVAILND